MDQENTKSFSNDDLVEVLTVKPEKAEDAEETTRIEGNKPAERLSELTKRKLKNGEKVNSVRLALDITSELDQAINWRIAKAIRGEKKRTDVVRKALTAYLSGELEGGVEQRAVALYQEQLKVDLAIKAARAKAAEEDLERL